MAKHNKKKNLQRKFKKWSFGTVNIRTDSDKIEQEAKLYDKMKQINKSGVIFCGLQEVRRTGSGHKLVELDTGEKYDFYWSGFKQKREHGVGILIKHAKGVIVDDISPINQRLMSASLSIHGFKLKVIVAYAPTDCTKDHQKQSFYCELNKLTKTRDHKKQKILVIGDFNATTDIASKRCYFDGKKFVHHNSNNNGERLINFCRSNKLNISNTFFKHRRIHRITWYSNDGKTCKILDYVLAEKFVQQYITNCRVRGGFIKQEHSDHRLLVTNICSPITKQARYKFRNRPRPSPKPDLQQLHDPDVCQRYVNAIDTQLMCNDEQMEIDEASSNILHIVNTAAEETIPKKKSRVQQQCPWKVDAVLNLLFDKRHNLSPNTADYITCCKDIKKRINLLKNQHLQQEANEINQHATKREIEELFRSMQSDGSTYKNVNKKSACEPSLLRKHFFEHFNPSIPATPPAELIDIPQYIKELQQLPFTANTAKPDIAEIINTLKSLKCRKSANDAPAELFKYAHDSKPLVSEIYQMLGKIWETKQIPKSWGHSKMVTLWKGAAKGSAKKPDTYRALQVGSSLCKIMMTIILNRLKPWYDNQLLDQQQGFRSGRGTSDGIYVTKRVQQITDRMMKPVYVLFVDLSAAFDHVVRKWLFMSIYQRLPADTDPILIQLLEALYSYTTTALAEVLDDIFELIAGVRQGGPESPPLYNLLMDYIMRVFTALCEEHHIKFLQFKYRVRNTACPRAARGERQDHGEHKADWSGYADDLKLFFEDATNLQRALILLDETFCRFLLEINISKTKTMIMNYQYVNTDEPYPKTICHLNNIEVENVETFRDLGDNIKYNEPATGNAEIDLRMNLANAKFSELKAKFCNHRISLVVRVEIMNSLVRSRLTYSCQTWNLSVRQQERVNSCYVGLLRRMLKDGFMRKDGTFLKKKLKKKQEEDQTDEEVEYRFKFTNEDILRICRAEPVMAFVKKQQKKYVAHLARQSNDSITKRLLFNDDKYSKRGNLQRTLEQQVLSDCQITADKFYSLALKKLI